MTSPPPRPRIVNVAFWSWLVAAVLLLVGGILAFMTDFDFIRSRAPANVTDQVIRSYLTFYHGAAGLSIVLGVAIGYLAGRTRGGDNRFRRAAVALSLTVVVVLLLSILVVRLVLPLSFLAAIALLVGAVLVTRSQAAAWFDTVDAGGNGD
jgi:heme A synthase